MFSPASGKDICQVLNQLDQYHGLPKTNKSTTMWVMWVGPKHYPMVARLSPVCSVCAWVWCLGQMSPRVCSTKRAALDVSSKELRSLVKKWRSSALDVQRCPAMSLPQTSQIVPTTPPWAFLPHHGVWSSGHMRTSMNIVAQTCDFSPRRKHLEAPVHPQKVRSTSSGQPLLQLTK